MTVAELALLPLLMQHFILGHCSIINAEQLTNSMKQLRYAATISIWYAAPAVAYTSRAFGGLLIIVMHAELRHMIIWQDAEVTLQDVCYIAKVYTLVKLECAPSANVSTDTLEQMPICHGRYCLLQFSCTL